MPLVVLCGLPSSGKTTVANDLLFYFKSRLKTVLVSELETDTKHSRESIYSNTEEEKQTSGSFISRINRELDQQTLVIADGMNYVKGFRYQLYVLSKDHKTRHCVIYIATSESSSLEYNRSRLDEKYPEKVFSELVFRFEEPSFSARWDKPCFPVLSGKDLPFDELERVLLVQKKEIRSVFFDTQKIEARIEEIVKKIERHELPGFVFVFKRKTYLERKLTSFDVKRLKAHFIGLFWRQKTTVEELDEGILEAIKTISATTDGVYSQ